MEKIERSTCDFNQLYTDPKSRTSCRTELKSDLCCLSLSGWRRENKDGTSAREGNLHIQRRRRGDYTYPKRNRGRGQTAHTLTAPYQNRRKQVTEQGWMRKSSFWRVRTYASQGFRNVIRDVRGHGETQHQDRIRTCRSWVAALQVVCRSVAGGCPIDVVRIRVVANLRL